MATELVIRNFNNCNIRQRNTDGYLDATAMCKATGKLFADYRRLSSTEEFLAVLSKHVGLSVMGNHITEKNQYLVQIIQGGTPEKQGTWVHPKVAIHLAQWCSAKFAVLVVDWVFDILTKGFVTCDDSIDWKIIRNSIEDIKGVLTSLGIEGKQLPHATAKVLHKETGIDLSEYLPEPSAPKQRTVNLATKPMSTDEDDAMLLLEWMRNIAPQSERFGDKGLFKLRDLQKYALNRLRNRTKLLNILNLLHSYNYGELVKVGRSYRFKLSVPH